MFQKPAIYPYLILLLAFYYSTLTIALPISRIKPRRQIWEFKVSKWRFLLVLGALICEGAFVYRSFMHLKNCIATLDCSQSYVTLIEACYAFTLLFIALFALPYSLSNFLSTVSSNLTSSHQVNKYFLFKMYVKCFSLYVLIITELVRKNVLEISGSSAPIVLQTIYIYYTKCLIYSFDNLLLALLFLLEIHFYVLNHRLGLIAQRGKLSQLHILLSDHWHTVTILKQVSTCLGPLFLGTLVYKQLQVAGMIYFNLLSNLPDDGDDLFQILDTFLPVFILSSICVETSKVLYQILSYSQLLNCRNIQITACNFIIIRAGLILKIAVVASTSIIAVVQLNPLPDNITITD